ncbi:HNH endonuclease [Natrialba aegyptia]|uniref:HNH endonuclease n=1 Tax=Natrialba aegyptia TaxID=129789 RepID=UPI00403B009A
MTSVYSTTKIDHPWRNEGLLRRLYIDEQLSTKEISNRLDCGVSTVSKWLKRHGIPTRGPGGTDAVCDTLKDGEKLREEYLTKEKSTHELADELDVCAWTVHQYLIKHDIPRRGFGNVGEDNGNYKGGHTDDYGPSYQRQRKKALERDDYECQVCGMTQTQHKQERGEQLHIHHIRPFRKYGVENHEEANRLGNLISLCQQCHSRWEGVPVVPRRD